MITRRESSWRRKSIGPLRRKTRHTRVTYVYVDVMYPKSIVRATWPRRVGRLKLCQGKPSVFRKGKEFRWQICSGTTRGYSTPKEVVYLHGKHASTMISRVSFLKLDKSLHTTYLERYKRKRFARGLRWERSERKKYFLFLRFFFFFFFRIE